MKILLILVGIWKGERWEPRQIHRGGGGVFIEKRTETNTGEGGGGRVLACVYVRFFEKNAEIFMKFYSYSPVFPIDYNGSMKY